MRGRSVAVEARVPLDLIIDVMATYRLTRLATADVISEPIRRSIVSRVLPDVPDASDAEAPRTAQEIVDELPDAPKVATLITCRWCAGVWIAAGVVAARTIAPQLWDPVARGLTLSAGAVLLARLED